MVCIKEGKGMPALSMFFGIIVRMQSEKGGRHNKPHIHAIHEEELNANWQLLSHGDGYFKIEPLR